MKHLARNFKEALLLRKYEKSGNGHIFYYWDSLENKEKDYLIHQLSDIKLKQIKKYFNETTSVTGQITPSDYTSADYLSLDEKKAHGTAIKERGCKALSSGEVAFLTVAGGQASRLGFEQPKGCFGISPVNKHSLFRIFAEKIRFYSEYYKHHFKWFIMTSEDNFNDTKAFFENNKYFGLPVSSVFFFKQGMLPTLTSTGKLILKDAHTLFMNPDGHGGILKALIKSGLTDRMSKEGIKYLSYFQVDNPLINMADPYMIGHHILTNSQVTTKVIKKSFPEEKLGSIVRSKKNNSSMVIEYSDMPLEMMNSKKNDGTLSYEMGSIGIHVFTVDFIKKTTKSLPVHTAKKSVAGLVFDNTPPVQGTVESFKFETFVFDTIPLAKQSAFFETMREEEFFPLKNATGVDSIETCTNGQIELYRSWLKAAGFTVNDSIKKIEISPLYAPDRELFMEKSGHDREKIQEILNKNGDFVEIS